MTAAAVIVAGGRGVRMGADVPKQFLLLGGKPILERTLGPFLACRDILEVVIAAPREHIAETERVAASLAPRKPVRVVEGGRERQESVRLGIAALACGADIVLVHDAVRPFITADLIESCIFGAARTGAVTVARPVKETIKTVEDGMVTGTPDRSRYRIVQTPQAFRTGLITEAHERARAEGFLGTDDCMLVERLGHPVAVIEGDDTNIKITTPADLAAAGALLTYIEEFGGKRC